MFFDLRWVAIWNLVFTKKAPTLFRWGLFVINEFGIYKIRFDSGGRIRIFLR